MICSRFEARVDLLRWQRAMRNRPRKNVNAASMIDLAGLIHECAPGVAPATIQAIIRTESSFNPLALNVNGNVRLQSQPKTAAQAASWSQWLIDRGYSIDMGLMQINSRNLERLNLTPAEVFDPCQNIRAGATILTADYKRAAKIHGDGTKALLHAISSYNTGTFDRGFRNGYVAKVVSHSSDALSGAPVDLTCLLRDCVSESPKLAGSAESYAVESTTRDSGVTRKFTRAMAAAFARARPTILVLLALVAGICVHLALAQNRKRLI